MWNPLRYSLNSQILLGMVLGAATGLFFGEKAIVLSPIGDAFIMLLKMSILPFMSFSLIHAIGSLSSREAADLFKQAVLFLSLLWVVSLSVIFAVTVIFPEQNIPLYHSSLGVLQDGDRSLLRLFIPVNPFHAFANDIIPAVVLFSLLFGVALIELKKKGDFLDNIKIVVSALMNITRLITKVSPIGVFALMANTVGTVPFAEFDKIRLYVMAYALGILFLGAVLLPLLVSTITPVRARDYLRELRPAFLLAFTTGNALISLPYVMEGLNRLNDRYQPSLQEPRKTVESMVPIAYNFPTIGNLFGLLFILFLSFFYAHPLSFGDHFQLVALGLPALFGAANTVITAVSFLIDQMGLPIDGVSLFAETLPLTRNLQTVGSTMGIAAVTLWISFGMAGNLSLQPLKLVRNGAFASIAFVLLVVTMRWMGPGEVHLEETFSSLELTDPQPARVLGDEKIPPASHTQKDAFDRFAATHQLRVGYNPDNMPFAYFNKSGHLVGYDIALAHDLARALDAELLFIPFRYATLANQLEEHQIDIAMSSVSVTEERLREMRFSVPYITAERALIVRDSERASFSQLDGVKFRDDIEVCVLEGSSLLPVATEQFPMAKITPLPNVDAFLGREDHSVLLWTQDEGTTWSLRNPAYTVVVPAPSMGNEYYAYALGSTSLKLIDFVDYWLELKEKDGFLDTQQAYWVHGKSRHGQPRWSVIRDVLKWID